MLIRFEVENFRSIKEPQELSMVAIDEDRPHVRAVDGLGVSLVPVAGIFGPNASGKSTVLAALTWLVEAVSDSLARWGDEIPVEPFALRAGPAPETSFALDVAVAGVRYEYLLDLDSNRVSYEALFHYPLGRRRRLFEREGLDFKLQSRLGRLTEAGVEPLLTDRTLALSIIRKFDEPVTRAFVDTLFGLHNLGRGADPRDSRWRFALSREIFRDGAGQGRLPGLESTPQRAQALALLRMADLGITEVEVVDRRAAMPGRTFEGRLSLLHQADGEQYRLPFESESDGTRAWFELIGSLVTVLEVGGLALFDEMDASLHPTLTAQVVELFENPRSNPSDAQLIFTSHDTNLLNHLNRDEVWLTEKGRDGATRLGALSDFAGERVRSSANLERGYLSGRFGALPDVSRPEVLRQLGLIG